MDFLLFDEYAIYSYVTSNSLQNVHSEMGKKFVSYIRGGTVPSDAEGDIFEATVIMRIDNGLLFCGECSEKDKHRVYCIDLTTCQILTENDESLLSTIQKSMRTALKIWHKQPFSVSERVSRTKSILFPFVYPDRRRLVIEREPHIQESVKAFVDFPLLAYKYNAEDAPLIEEIPPTDVIVRAIKAYNLEFDWVQQRLRNSVAERIKPTVNRPFQKVEHKEQVGRSDFPYRTFEEQQQLLTDAQKRVVYSQEINLPLRIEGAAGTGKTCSLIMRAYWLLKEYKKNNVPLQTIFFAHSFSTNQRNTEMFQQYPDADQFLSGGSKQSIRFITLLDFCMEISDFSAHQLPERDAGETKFYQQMLIDHALEKIESSKMLQTYYANLSWEMQEVFNPNRTQRNVLIAMLQHEFSVQIKGRTDGTIESYKALESIPNGLPCRTDIDKDLVYSVYLEYQNVLAESGEYDLDDVTMETLSRLNAPKWRRERRKNGYDYILIDEMHLFNINEKSIFHFLSKDMTNKKQPFCFALDYGQAIGDQGRMNKPKDDSEFPHEDVAIYDLVFRNSPSILSFCASIATSGIIMFQNDFLDPYKQAKSVLADSGRVENEKPCLYMYSNEQQMLQSIKGHVKKLKKELHCKASDIVIISFDERYSGEDGPDLLQQATGGQVAFFRLSGRYSQRKDGCPIASPYDVNGMEFQAVILLGVDEGRVPQTTGTSDISKHYVLYTAYNLLYLTSSRAIYKLIILGNEQHKESSCLSHSIAEHYLDIANNE